MIINMVSNSYDPHFLLAFRDRDDSWLVWFEVDAIIDLNLNQMHATKHHFHLIL